MTGARATQWPAVLVAALAGVACAFNVGKVPVALPALRSEFGLSLLQAGWVAAMLNTLAVCGALGVGLLIGRVGALRMTMIGLAASALGALAALAAGGYGALLATRIVEGAGFLAVSVAAPALVSAAAAPQDRRFALGIWSSYMPLGAGLAMALAPLLLPGAGWRGLWLAAAAVLVLTMALLAQQRPAYRSAARSAHAGEPVAHSLRMLRQPLPWLLALAFAVWALQHFALIVWLPTFLKEQRGFGDAAVAGLTAAMLLANVPGNLIGGALVQRGASRGRLIAAAQLATGLCGWGLASDALGDGLRYALCVALSFVGGLIPAAVMSASTQLARTPAQIGACQGLFMQGSQLGQFVGTPLIAAVVAASGQWSSARWVTAGAAVIGVIAGVATWRLEQHRP